MRDELTNAERLIYDEMIKGRSNEDIAKTLHNAVKTVKFHITHIFDKLGVKSRSELLAKHYAKELKRAEQRVHDERATLEQNLRDRIAHLEAMFAPTKKLPGRPLKERV